MSANAPEYDIGGYVSRSFEMYTKDIVNWIIIGLVGTLALGVGAWGGFHNCALKAYRGEKPEVSDVLMPFSRFVDFFIPLLIIMGGLMLCFLPGLYLGIIWFFMYPIMIDKGVGWQDATRMSKEVASQNLVMTFVLGVVGGIIGQVGGVIGLPFLTAPLAGMFAVMAYLHVFGGPQQLAHQAAGGGWGAPQGQPQGAPQGQWGAPQGQPQQPQGQWGAPQGQPQQPQGQWGAPQGQPQQQAPQQPAPGGWGQPQQQAPQQPQQPAPGGHAVQSTTTDESEAHHGKTMAMSAMDFESMLNNDPNKPNS